jgi:hypothetical protein
MRLEVLATKHRSLAVTACEWRAFGLADPERLADAVFDRLLTNPDPTLADFYTAVDQVVQQAYARYAAEDTILDRLTGNFSMPGRRAPTDEMLQALSQLRTRHRLLLQLRYWDGLSEAEAAEALRLDEVSFANRQAKAEAKFLGRVSRRRPELAYGNVAELVAGAKPGRHVRRVA